MTPKAESLVLCSELPRTAWKWVEPALEKQDFHRNEQADRIRERFLNECFKVYDQIPPEERRGYFLGKMIEGLRLIDRLTIAEYNKEL